MKAERKEMPATVESITIENLLPRVFENSVETASEVWRRRITFRRGRHYIIEAESGTGKSSLCAFLYGSRKDYLGSICFGDTDTSTLDIEDWQRLRRTAIAYLPQDLDLFPELTAMENVEIKRCLTDAVRQTEVKEWFRMTGIADRADFPCGKMSVGQQQRTAIVRALCQPFDFLILDEPVSHLDAENNRRCADIIIKEAQRRGAAIIATSVGNKLYLPDAEILRL